MMTRSRKRRRTDHDDDDADEVLMDANSEEDMVQNNEAANKQFPLAHRLLEDIGFMDYFLFESVITLLMRSLALCRSKRAWA